MKLSISVRFVFISSVLVFSSVVQSGPWIDTNQPHLRLQLESLVDQGVLDLPLSTWPLMWADVNRAIQKVDKATLSAHQRHTINAIKYEMRYQTRQKSRRAVSVTANSSTPFLRSVESPSHEQYELVKSLDWMGQNIAGRLQVNVRASDEESADGDFYGTYLAGVLGGSDGNWVLGAGAIERWWGASSDSSLILSNNALPVPAVFLRTKQEQTFTSPFLSWLGAWQFISFVGQMESDRFIPEAKLTGMRFTFRPVDGLELGLSRAMQWGGVGRSDQWDTFLRSLTSQGENSKEGSGNQLAGYDARYHFKLAQQSVALYAQSIGEDEAGYLPARRTYQFGAQLGLSEDLAKGVRVGLEYTNTTADPFASVFSDITYEHSVYQSGYRYRGRALAATYDNDTEVLSASLSLWESGYQLSRIVLSRINFNEDGSNRRNPVSSGALSTYQLRLYHQQLFCNGLLRLSASVLGKKPDTSYENVEKWLLGASWTYRY